MLAKVIQHFNKIPSFSPQPSSLSDADSYTEGAPPLLPSMLVWDVVYLYISCIEFSKKRVRPTPKSMQIETFNQYNEMLGTYSIEVTENSK